MSDSCPHGRHWLSYCGSCEDDRSKALAGATAAPHEYGYALTCAERDRDEAMAERDNAMARAKDAEKWRDFYEAQAQRVMRERDALAARADAEASQLKEEVARLKGRRGVSAADVDQAEAVYRSDGMGKALGMIERKWREWRENP